MWDTGKSVEVQPMSTAEYDGFVLDEVASSSDEDYPLAHPHLAKTSQQLRLLPQ